MKTSTAVAIAFVVVGVATCTRLGLWQLSRWQEKRRLNAAAHAALALPPLEPGGAQPARSLAGRRVRILGRFDLGRQVLLSGRARDGSPGVEVLTPMLLYDGSAYNGSAVLVNRGWQYAADAATALPAPEAQPARAVTGIAATLGSGGARARMHRLPVDSVALWSTVALDRDTLTARLGLPLAPWLVRELPGPGVPAQPARLPPPHYDETMHLSYALQWFLFALILLGGSAALAWSRGRTARGSRAEPELGAAGRFPPAPHRRPS